ncbi:MAG TPA: type II toxin-antitoxin system VapC family toxin [Myxococcota bacterium]|nr:type II toxin-antitoxin system VapC family toxin [Myxococcota bacterium]
MKLAIDSNRYTDLARGDRHCIEIIKAASEIYMPLIVLGELRAGFAYGSKLEKNESVLAKFLNEKSVFVLCPDEQTTHYYADIYAMLKKKGQPIPTNDMWIAALVWQHNLVLFARDRDFDALTQLARI